MVAIPLAVVSAFLFFFSVVLHELGHALVARRNGIQITTISLWLFGGMADLRSEPRWPDFGRRAAETTGVLSMLSIRLYFEDPQTAELRAGLNLYASKPHAFEESDETVAVLLGTHGALALAAAHQQQRADGLALAQQSNRTIGTAIGILMARLLVTGDQAFDLLRISSQRSNRKLRDIAQDVIDTGKLGDS